METRISASVTPLIPFFSNSNKRSYISWNVSLLFWHYVQCVIYSDAINDAISFIHLPMDGLL